MPPWPLWWSSPHCIHCPNAAPPAPPLALHIVSAHPTDAPEITTYATSNTLISYHAHQSRSCHSMLTHIPRQTSLLRRPRASFIKHRISSEPKFPGFHPFKSEEQIGIYKGKNKTKKFLCICHLKSKHTNCLTTYIPVIKIIQHC